MTAVQDNTGITTMSYDKENRLVKHQSTANSVATYLYGLDGLRAVEDVDGGFTTLVWEGSDYLQGRS